MDKKSLILSELSYPRYFKTLSKRLFRKHKKCEKNKDLQFNYFFTPSKVQCSFSICALDNCPKKLNLNYTRAAASSQGQNNNCGQTVKFFSI